MEMEEPRQGEKALVLYASMFGNTEKIAKALAKGIEFHCQVDCVNINDADPAGFSQYGLIAVGAPTQAFSAYKPMKDFLEKLSVMTGLGGKLGFAFDTRIDSRLSGSAAKYIEKRLDELGLKMVKPRASAIVSGGTKDNVLRQGEDARFEGIGEEIGAVLARLPVAKSA